MNKCIVCGNYIKRDFIPRIKPIIDKVVFDGDDVYPVCETCGNMLSLMTRFLGDYQTEDGENIVLINESVT